MQNCPNCGSPIDRNSEWEDTFGPDYEGTLEVDRQKLTRLLHLLNNAESMTEALEMVNLVDSLEKELQA